METHSVTGGRHALSEFLEASGNRRQMINQELDLDLVFSEQQKLRDVLDWAQSFLSGDSEDHHESCRSSAQGQPSLSEYHHPVSCAAGGNEVFERGGRMQRVWHFESSNYENSASDKHPFSHDPCHVTPWRDEATWYGGATESKEQTPASEGAADLAKESQTRWSKRSAVFDRDTSGHQIELSKVKAEGKVGTAINFVKMKGKANKEQDSSSASMQYAHSEPERTQEQIKNTLKMPPHFMVYEQYQLCVDQLHRLKLRQHIEPGCFMEAPAKERKTTEETPVEAPGFPLDGFESKPSNTDAGFQKHQVTTGKITKERKSDIRRSRSNHSACRLSDCKYSPPGVPVCDGWLCLPDEVWLCILSLLPLADLCTVLQVCSRLHALATDHTLWKDLRIENCDVTDRWLLCVSRRRPRSLRLYSCCGPSLTSCGLEMFFTLCRKTLEEVKVTSCTGPGLHGDQLLRLIGQLCDHVTDVDVSWSGATDAGVTALSGSCAGLQLKSVVLNGCHVTDDSLMKLILRHKKSLCRLEVFGCQFLTPSCLQSIYEMCSGLEHLNIGQVPKVNAQSLTVMTLQLKCLISLNLTGLQAVCDATVDALLQSCVKLQSMTLSSCPGVTDRALHSISKYTPFIRALDVSGCKAITDAGVQSLALGCRRLQQLDLSSTGTRSRGVTLLANYCGGHLQTVKLSFCRITSGNILKLCSRCKRLKVLHLYGCSRPPTEREIREVNTTVQVYPPP